MNFPRDFIPIQPAGTLTVLQPRFEFTPSERLLLPGNRSWVHVSPGAGLLEARVLAGVLARRSPGPLAQAGAGDREDAVGERAAPKLTYTHRSYP